MFTAVHSAVIVENLGQAPMETKGLDSGVWRRLGVDRLQWKYRGPFAGRVA